jgi:subtilisin family serine protease
MAILPWTLVLTIILSRAASLDVGAQISHENNKNIIPNHFIVQLQSPVANSRQEDFEAYAKKAGLDVNIKTTFSDTSIFYGVHLETPSASINRTVAQLNELPLVEKVWPSQMYYQPDYIVKSVLDTSPSDIDISQRLSTLSMTGVDKLHAEGIYGKGVKVGIIDSGIDYTLPELGGGFGPGYLVEFGYDFVGDNYGSTGVAVPDDDPLTTCSNGGHGTHVSSSICILFRSCC